MNYIFWNFLFVLVTAQWIPGNVTRPSTNQAAQSTNLGQNLVAINSTIHTVWYVTPNAPALPRVYYSQSSDGGTTWPVVATPLSQSTSSFDTYPYLSVSGSYVHVTWTRTPSNDPNNQIFLIYRRSQDGGKTWDNENNLGVCGSPYLSMTSAGSYVYINYVLSPAPQQYEVVLLRSNNNGQTWDNLRQIATGSIGSPSISAFNNFVYLIYLSANELSSRYSLDYGQTWNTQTSVIKNVGLSWATIFVSSLTDVSIAYNVRISNVIHVFTIVSIDGGNTFQAPVDHTTSTVEPVCSDNYPSLWQSGPNIHLLWSMTACQVSTPSIIKYQKSTDYGKAWSSISSLYQTGISLAPFISGSGSTVHITWTDFASYETWIRYARNPTGN